MCLYEPGKSINTVEQSGHVSVVDIIMLNLKGLGLSQEASAVEVSGYPEVRSARGRSGPATRKVPRLLPQFS